MHHDAMFRPFTADTSSCTLSKVRSSCSRKHISGIGLRSIFRHGSDGIQLSAIRHQYVWEICFAVCCTILGKGTKRSCPETAAICSVFNSTDCTSSSWRIVLSVRFYLDAALSGTGNRLPHCCGITAVTAAGHGVSLLYHAIIQHFTGHWQSRFARQIYAALRCCQAAGKHPLPANSSMFPLGGWAVNQSLLCSAVRHDAFLPLSDAGDVPPWIKAHSSTVLCSDNEHHDCVSVPKSDSSDAVARYAAVQRWQCSCDVRGCTIVAGKDRKPSAGGALFADGLRLAHSSPVAEFCFLLLFSYIHLICQLTAFQNYDIIYGM